MPTRNVVLTGHQASLVEHLVSTGLYQNASEVLREGLRMVEQREAKHASHLEALRQAVRVGVDDFEQGRYAMARYACCGSLGSSGLVITNRPSRTKGRR